MNIAEILKSCQTGMKLYSSIHGEVELVCVNEHKDRYPIYCKGKNGNEEYFTSDGRVFSNYPDAECVLFPSKEQRDWSKFVFTDKKTKCQFKPYDRVLVRDYDSSRWKCELFSYADVENRTYICVGSSWRQCIPYEGNEHLLGTTNKPEQ